MKQVVITGLGVVSSLGCDLATVTDALRSSRTGFAPNPDMLATGLQCGVFAPVSGFDRKRLSGSRRQTMSISAMYAACAAQAALEDAALETASDSDAFDRERAGVIVGSEFGGINELSKMHRLLEARKKSRAGAVGVTKSMNSGAAGNVASLLGFRGRSYSPSSSFSTGTDCLGQGYELIQHGLLDIAVCGSTEEESWLQLGPYLENLDLISGRYNDTPERACRPYDVDRSGTILSSGAGIVVLESLDHAVQRAAPIQAEIVGYGSTNDGDDLFRPSGRGLTRALHQTLEQARERGVEQIDYVNSHGTGTRTGDEIECEALRAVFGEGPWISATKSLSGHALGAAGALEVVFSVLMLREGFVAATANLEVVDPKCRGLRHAQERVECPLESAISFSIGLGGTNSALALRRTPAL